MAANAETESSLIVCLTGPESTGKSTLAKALAEEFAAPLVSEAARDYLTGRDGYDREDVLAIARMQLAAEQTMLDTEPRLMICDTDLLVIRIWWEEKYGTLDPWLREALLERCQRHYLLMRPDLPWVADSLRDAPHDRERLYTRYRLTLAEDGFPVVEISGSGHRRTDQAVAQVRAWWQEQTCVVPRKGP